MRRFRCLTWCVLSCSLWLGHWYPAGGAEERRSRPVGRALLIGCTQYDNNSGMELRGPGNDLILMRKMLVERLGFSDKNIDELSEKAGQGDPEKRPKRANIERAFQRLARVTERGDRVVVFLAGHGSQQPEKADVDQIEAKPDGMAEVFLPADVGRWDAKKGEVTNVIVDRDFRQWIKTLVDQGALVFGIVDSCHSGTMLRGDSEEVVRGVPPQRLGIPPAALEEAGKKAKQRPRTPSGYDPGIFSKRDMPPNFIALYACQSGEPTLERPMPPDQQQRVLHGLLTFALCQALDNATRSPSYRELFDAVQARYIRWGHADTPSPLLEGRDLDRRLLDTAISPARRQFILKPGESGWTIPAGLLAGLGEGSLLAVYPEGRDQPIGYVRIQTSNLFTALVQPWAFAGLSPPKDEQLRGAFCEPAQIVLGAARLRVGIDPLNEQSRGAPTRNLNGLRRDLKNAAKAKDCRFEVVDELRAAEWLLQARDGRIALLPASAARRLGELPADTPLFTIREEDSTDRLVEQLDHIARARNLMDLVGVPGQQFFGAAAAQRGEEAQRGADVQVQFEMYKLRDRFDTAGARLRSEVGRPALKAGDWVSWKIVNPNDFPVDVTLFFIDATYRMSAVFPARGLHDNRLEPQKPRTFGPARVTAKTVGIEHMLLLALPSQGAPVDLGFLAEKQWDTQRGASLDSPLQRLVKASMFADTGVRGLNTDIESYAGRLISWRVTSQPANAAKE